MNPESFLLNFRGFITSLFAIGFYVERLEESKIMPSFVYTKRR